MKENESNEKDRFNFIWSFLKSWTFGNIDRSYFARYAKLVSHLMHSKKHL